MVVLKYQGDVENTYTRIKDSACGRQACSILILIANEVDAMASCRMLTQLLRVDSIAYALRPVSNFNQVIENYQSFMTSEIKTVIMINCGAMNNIKKAFNLEQGGDVRCIIFDNHRPIHLANKYSRDSVVVFDDETEMERESRFMPSSGSEADEPSCSDSSDEDKDDEDDDDDVDEGDEEDDSGSDVEAEENFEEGDGDGEEDGASSNGEEAEEVVDEDVEVEGGGDQRGELIPGSAGADSSASRRNSGRDADDEGDGGAEGTTEDLEDEDDAEGGGDVHALKQALPRQEDDDEDGPVRIIGRRRRAMAEVHDPVRVRRRKLREYYSVDADYAAPTAMMMMNLVWGRSGANVPLDLVWQAILGVTDQYQRAHITDEYYEELCHNLRILLTDHLSSASERVRCTVGEGDKETVVSGAETGHIQEVPEYRFFLYRHWSMFDAMYHSPYIASKMPVWLAEGTVRLKELLAKMGVPLYQCEQMYTFMAPHLKNHFRQEIIKDSLKAEFNLQNPDVTYRSFYRYNSFKNPVGASDVVHAASSLLEMFSSEEQLSSQYDGSHSSAAGSGTGGSKGALRQVAFNEAYDCLGMQSEILLKKGVLTALALQRMIVKQAGVMIEAHESIQQLGRLYFAYVHQSVNVTASSSEGEMDLPFSRPLVLTRLGQFIMEVKRNTSKGRGGWVGRRRLFPLILIVQKKNSCLVVGISPLSTMQGGLDLSRADLEGIGLISNFRQFFKLAARDTGVKPLIESFDANVVEVSKDVMHDFLGSLNNLLKNATKNYFANTGEA